MSQLKTMESLLLFSPQAFKISYKIIRAPIAQRIEHRSSDLAKGIPTSYFTFKLELLCQFPKTYFVRKIPFGDNPFRSVC